MSSDSHAAHSSNNAAPELTPETFSVTPGAAGPLTLERALLNGLGVSDLHLPEGLTPVLMHTVGMLLREATQGTIDLLRLRAEAKSSLHADITMLSARAVNPLKAAWDADVALEHLLAPQRNDMMTPVRAIVDAYDDLRLHDRGLASGIQAAITGLLQRFQPAEFEHRVGAANALDHLMPANRRARQWDLLLERFDDFSIEAREDFWAAFEKEFCRAYANGQVAAPNARE